MGNAGLLDLVGGAGQQFAAIDQQGLADLFLGLRRDMVWVLAAGWHGEPRGHFGLSTLGTTQMLLRAHCKDCVYAMH